MRPNRTPLPRLLCASAVAVAVVATAFSVSSPGHRLGSLHGAYSASKDMAVSVRDDRATKNAVSRAGSLGQATEDPTTAAERRASAAYVADNRETPDPPLTTTPVREARQAVPEDRYAMAGGCYSMAGQPIRFQATDLGSYLLYTRDESFVSADGLAEEPSEDADWTAAGRDGRYTFRLADGRWLTTSGGGFAAGDQAQRFSLNTTTGCPRYPEAAIGVSGAPFSGTTSYQEVRGYVDAHTHGMAFEFLGGGVHCGKPWDRYGAPYALVDCEDHRQTQGRGAVLESVLSGEPSHDPVGWPTFKDWPAPNSLTHEGTYFRWLERSWRGGQRLFVNLLVENNQLCELYPLPPPHEKNSCDDMDSVRLQAKRMYEMQDYIDAQFGGPGEGFYRIVKSPWQARRVINAGKLAVVMGIETSVPFGCTSHPAKPTCDPASIEAQLDEVHDLGVRQMELVNKFDNALSGVAGDNGEVGVAVNSANFRETNSFWDMRHCEPEHPDAHDKNQLAAPEISADQQDALFGAIGELFGATGTALPVYPPPDHCNERGLTTLGEQTIAGLAERHMLFDPDHMSVKARNAALDQVEEMGYPGILSSHSWSTEDAYPRIYELGGYIAPYAGDSTGFVEKWRAHLGWADSRYYFGFGYGADMNGLGAQGDPRGTDVSNPVTYPFTGLGGVTIDQQVAGERVYDINADGVAQYGLYPDWIEDLRMVAGGSEGDAIVEDMARGAEAYLQTWERAEGIAPDSCRNPELRKRESAVQDLIDVGMTTRQVMEAVGQPYTRLGHAFTFCARTAAEPEVRMRVTFDDGGRVTGISRA
ncbi:hypothetical protein [Nocardioides sp.]|uniref:hypothetical protein n=1 Tax=Nocardioides sp. TaxID=35761 RepID=UPI002D7EB2AC|nr:hypothetical protein [Nocardioides sp.]HET8960741.1 hypothetical protein [Nocardioides sp.]